MRSALIVLLTLPATAAAWSPTGRVLAESDRPLRVSVEKDVQIPGLSAAETLADIQAAVAAWSAASCALDAIFVGEVAYADPTDVPVGQLHLTFADLGSGAAPWLRLGPLPGSEVVYERDGRVFRRSEAGAFVVNSSLPFTSDAAINAEECQGKLSLSSVIGLLIGDNLGLGLSRSSDALMSYSLNNCEIVRPGADDVEGLDTLYGPWFGLTCTGDDLVIGDTEVAGVVPFDLSCDLLDDGISQVTSSRWSWGDGERSDGAPAAHTYVRDDNYSLRIEVTAEHPSCGTVERKLERYNYVRACGDPKPDFRVERDRGLRFLFINASDVRTYGCHTDVSWQVYDEGGDEVASVTVWEPLIILPGEGRYRVVMTLSGPAGATEVESWIDTRDSSVRGYEVGGGCSTSPAPLTMTFLAGLWFVLGRRRR